MVEREGLRHACGCRGRRPLELILHHEAGSLEAVDLSMSHCESRCKGNRVFQEIFVAEALADCGSIREVVAEHLHQEIDTQVGKTRGE